MIASARRSASPDVDADSRLRTSLGSYEPQRTAGLLLHPIVVSALGLLLLNDHVLKARYHNGVTGKLSDIAGLVFFPVLVVSVIEVGAWIVKRPVISRAPWLFAAGLMTALVFSGIQTVEPLTEFYRSVAGLLNGRQTMVVADETDVLAVPACFVGWWLDRLSRRRR